MKPLFTLPVRHRFVTAGTHEILGAWVGGVVFKGTLLGTQTGNLKNIVEYNRNIRTRVLRFHFIPTIFLGFRVCGSH